MIPVKRVLYQQRQTKMPERIHMKKHIAALLTITAFLVQSCDGARTETPATVQGFQSADSLDRKGEKMKGDVVKTDKEWKSCLSPEQYRILREKGTEMAFTGTFYHHDEDGNYTCAGCGNVLFSSDTKYDSGSGWPSYWEPASDSSITMVEDRALGMVRTEVQCARCGGHLGHVFDDGPQPTGLRYCINSTSLGFEKKEE